MRLISFAIMTMLLACSGQDPILDRAAEMEGGGTAPAPSEPAPPSAVAPEQPAPVAAAAPSPVAPGAPAPGAPSDPAPGDPGVPVPGDPGAPAPGDPDAPTPGVPDQPAPGVPGADGPTVALAGTVAVEGWSGGPIRIDVFDGDQRAAAGSAKRPSVVAQATVDRPGRFEVRVSTSAGRVWVGAFADENGNGRPDPRDPSGWYDRNPVLVDGDQGDIRLQLEAAPPPGGGVEME